MAPTLGRLFATICGVPIEDLISYATVPVIGALVLAALISRGWLSQTSLDDAPMRAGLSLMDLLLCVWMLLAMSLMVLRPTLDFLGIPLPKADPPPTSRQAAVTALISQAVTQLPVVLYVCWRAVTLPDGPRLLGLRPSRPGKEIVAGILGFLAAMPLVLGSSALFLLISRFLNLEAPKVAHELLRRLLTSHDAVAVSLMMISAVVIAPILEEVVFRGLVQTALLSWLGQTRRWLVVLAAAGLFAMVHAEVATWHVLPGLFILGVILGCLYEKYGSLLPCIVLHMLFNLANVALGMLQAE